MQNWVIIEEKYLNYLRSVEPRIPNSDYGANKFKPFFGVLFEKDELAYVTQISHARERHLSMRNAPDFLKVFIPSRDRSEGDRLVAVINLNYMFPVPKQLIQNLEYKDIELHRSFSSAKEKSMYVDLLTKEMEQINRMNVDKKARKVYFLKKNCPSDRVSLRCLDFAALETVACRYQGE